MSKDLNPITWADRDQELLEEINNISFPVSQEYGAEMKLYSPEVWTRQARANFRDGFRCGTQWVMENPVTFLLLLLKSAIRRLRGKNFYDL